MSDQPAIQSAIKAAASGVVNLASQPEITRAIMAAGGGGGGGGGILVETDPVWTAEKDQYATKDYVSVAKEEIEAGVATTLTAYPTEAEMYLAIQEAGTGLWKLQGEVPTRASLPSTAEDFWIYHIDDESADVYARTIDGSLTWQPLNFTVDLSTYETIGGATEKMNAAVSTSKSYTDAQILANIGQGGGGGANVDGWTLICIYQKFSSQQISSGFQSVTLNGYNIDFVLPITIPNREYVIDISEGQRSDTLNGSFLTMASRTENSFSLVHQSASGSNLSASLALAFCVKVWAKNPQSPATLAAQIAPPEVFTYVDTNTFTLSDTPKFVTEVVATDSEKSAYYLQDDDYTLNDNTITVTDPVLTVGMRVKVIYAK